MKSWLTKFRISTALDSGKPLPPSLRQKITADPELEHFAQQAQALGRPVLCLPSADPSLHDSIMRAVRASAQQREQPRRAPVFSWLAASAASAAVLMFCLWVAYPRSVSREMPSPFGGLAQLVKRAVAGAVLP
jgi:anti-sigma factor RsiW